MAITADVITHRKLVLIKNLYRRAVAQSANEHSILDRMLSVLTFDLAIETALKAALAALNPSTPLPSELSALIQKCDAALTSGSLPTVPDTRQIHDVRKIRNAVQHEARTPNPSEVGDSRTYTRDFLERFVYQVWGHSLERLRLADLIKDDEAREFLSKAEEAIEQGDYQSAAQQAHAALHVAFVYLEWQTIGLRPHSPRGFVMDDGERHSGELTYEAFNKMRQTVLFLTLGLDLGQYIRCKRLAGEVILTFDSDVEFLGTKEDLTAEEAEWVIAFCFDSLSEIEARVGKLQAPYGADPYATFSS